MTRALVVLVLVGLPAVAADPAVVGHRGLPGHAPEETHANFSACIDLRVGIELDVRRTRDGQLVCLHDATLDRTTSGTGKLAALSLQEVKRLDAGTKFDPAFAGERVPTLEEVFALLRARKAPVLIAVDLKEPGCEADVVKLADKYGVLKQLVFIGLTIEGPTVRQALLGASKEAVCAALCPAADKLDAVLADKTCAWVYVRFIPAAADVKRAHDAGKKVFLVGPLVAGHEPANWAKARAAGVDAILTDHALECRVSWKGEMK